MNLLAGGRIHDRSPLPQKRQSARQSHRTQSGQMAVSAKGQQQVQPQSQVQAQTYFASQPRFGYIDWSYMAGGYVVKTPEEHAFDAVLNKVRSDDQAFAHVDVQNWVFTQVKNLDLASKPAGTPLPEALQKQLNQLLAKSFEKSNFLVMSQLLKAGADPNGRFDNDPMLRWAIRANSEDGAALLVQYGAQTEYLPTENQKGFHAYIEAWISQKHDTNRPLATLLEQLGAAKLGKDYLGRNLLCWAAKEKDIHTLNQLLDEGHVATESLPHPVASNVSTNLLSYVMPWLEADHPLSGRLTKSIADAGLLQTCAPLLWEEISNLPEEQAGGWATKLMDLGLDPNPSPDSDYPPFLLAAQVGKVTLMKAMMAHKTPRLDNPLTLVDSSGKTALAVSLISGNPEAFLYLKSLGFPLDYVTGRGDGLFHELLNNWNLESSKFDPLFETLIQSGVPLNQQDNMGNTPLHRLTKRQNPRLVEAMLKAGANPLLKNDDGKMAVEVVDRTKTNPYMPGFSDHTLSVFYLLRDATSEWQSNQMELKEQQAKKDF